MNIIVFFARRALDALPDSPTTLFMVAGGGLVDSDGLSELNGKSVWICSNHCAIGFKMLFPVKGENDFAAGLGLFLASDENAGGADIVNEFPVGFTVDNIVHRNHAFPAPERTAARQINTMRVCNHNLFPSR